MALTTRPKVGRPPDPELRARRRSEILETAARMFAERGFSETDLQVVADRLGVGKGTVYRYFPTKRALFLAAVDNAMRELRERVEENAAGATDPLDRVARAIRAYLEFFDEHPQYVEVLIQERAQFKDRKKPTYFEHRDANIGPWQELFRGLIAEGRVRDVPVDRITDVISDLMYGTMFTNYFAGRRKPIEEQYQEILDILFYGILTPRGRS